MDTHLTTTNQLFTEFDNIKNNIVSFQRYQATITIKLVTNEGYHLKPRLYTFGSLNLCNIFENLLQQLQ